MVAFRNCLLEALQLVLQPVLQLVLHLTLPLELPLTLQLALHGRSRCVALPLNFLLGIDVAPPSSMDARSSFDLSLGSGIVVPVLCSYELLESVLSPHSCGGSGSLAPYMQVWLFLSLYKVIDGVPVCHRHYQCNCVLELTSLAGILVGGGRRHGSRHY